MNGYLDIDSNGYMYTHSLRASIETWLDALQRSQDSVRLSRSVMQYGVKRFELYKNLRLLT